MVKWHSIVIHVSLLDNLNKFETYIYIYIYIYIYVKVRYAFDERSEKLTNCHSNANVYGPHFHAISIPYQAWY